MNLGALLKDGFSYPFREDARMVLIWGTILGILMSLAEYAPFIGFFAVLALSAYFCAIFFDIILTTSSGSDDCVGFPSLSDFLDDLVLPYLKVALAFIVSFLPGFLLLFVIPESVFSWLLLLIPMAIYLPMAILAM